MTATQKLMFPAGTKKLAPGAGDGGVMNCRPGTKCLGSPGAAGPIVPTMRPVKNRGDSGSRLTPSTLNFIDRIPFAVVALSCDRRDDDTVSSHSMPVSTD